jgi:carboxyl-terminal processing protease
MKNLDRAMRLSGAKSGAAKFTIQKFYLPNGSSTQLNGVVPDIVLPSIEDAMESGESYLPHALVWDEINTTQFDGAPLEQHLLTPLREASLARQESLEEFQYLRSTIDWFTARQEQKLISLNLDERIRQRDADKEFQAKMDTLRKNLRDGNFAYTEYLLVPKEEKAASSEAAPSLPVQTSTGEAAESSTSVATVKDHSGAIEEVTVTDDMENAPEGEIAMAEGEAETLSTDEVEEPEPEGYARLDIHLREALRVLVDAAKLGQHPSYAERAPLTARSATGG